MIFRRLYTTLYNRSASTVRACSSLSRSPLNFALGNKSETNDCGLALTNIFIAVSHGFAKLGSLPPLWFFPPSENLSSRNITLGVILSRATLADRDYTVSIPLHLPIFDYNIFIYNYLYSVCF